MYRAGYTIASIQAYDANGPSVRETAPNGIIPFQQCASGARGPIPGLGPCDTYAVYYGPVNDQRLTELKAFDLVILHPDSGVTSTHVAELQAAGVVVLLYVSIGEEPPGDAYFDNRHGPVYYAPGEYCDGVKDRHCQHRDVASYYLDEDRDGKPDRKPLWNSYYVDPASPLWRDRVKKCVVGTDNCNFYGTDYIINTLGADGLFLDTVDMAGPWDWNPYSYSLDSMADLINTISKWYPKDRYIVMNRGVFFAVPEYGADVVRPSINGIVFEAFCSEWDGDNNEGKISPWCPDNRENWAPRLDAQSVMTDGYTLFALDYFTPTQQISITNHISDVVRGLGWLYYVSTPYLDTIRWDVWNYYHEQDLACVSISGPTKAIPGTTYTFLATVRPATTTTPITYVWQVSDGSDVIHTGGVSDTITFTRETLGARVMTVTAQNVAAKAIDRHTVNVVESCRLNLPFFWKNYHSQ
jgi:hypothetical protein